MKVYAGTLLLVPELQEADFTALAADGVRLVKFIFYDYRLLPTGEAERYVAWARARGIKVKIHSGGVSRSGVSQVTGAEVVKHVGPDIVGHVSGGPIPMAEADVVEALVADTDCFLSAIPAALHAGVARNASRTVTAQRDPGGAHYPSF